jgi:hypothetical protein
MGIAQRAHDGVVGHRHLAIDFPVYGLDSSWSGPRWLSFVQGERDQPLREVHLQHGCSRWLAPDRPWVIVITVPWRRSRHEAGDTGEAPERALAWYALDQLVGITLPAIPYPRDRELRRRIDPLVEDRAAHFVDWPVVSLTVDDAPVTAWTTSWAGAWTAFFRVLPDTACIVAAAGIQPGELSLITLTDGDDYHFNLRAPVEFPEALIASSEAALGTEPSPEDDHSHWPLHDDHLRLPPATKTRARRRAKRGFAPIELIAADQPYPGVISARRTGEPSFTHVQDIGDAMMAAMARGVDLIIPTGLANDLLRDLPDLPPWVKIR